MPLPPLPRIIIDSTAAVTELCALGYKHGADKSPYNEHGHRHPYTAVYTMLFAGLKGRSVRFAEIGVAGGASAHMWSEYFTHPDTKLVMFDRDMNFLQHCVERVKDERLRTLPMDVAVDGMVSAPLLRGADGLADAKYDVILDDSSHDLEHQLRIIREAFPFVHPGGMLIVEDVFKATPEEEYVGKIGEQLAGCAAAYFVVCEHAMRWSPGWDNDKMLILVKK